MALLRKFHFHRRLNIVQAISNFEPLKYVSTQVQEKEILTPAKKNQVQRKMKRGLLIPVLTRDKSQVLNNLTSITFAANYISWAQILVSNLTLLKWSAYELPMSILKEMSEIETIQLASVIRKLIPDSDLYVLETSKKFVETLNEIRLRTALIMQLHGLNKVSKIHDKVIIQDEKVLNILYDLQVGSERKSVKELVEDMFQLRDKNTVVVNNKPKCNFSIKISAKERRLFASSSRPKQESFSVALLIAFSFLDLSVFQNPITDQKVKKKLEARINKKPAVIKKLKF